MIPQLSNISLQKIVNKFTGNQRAIGVDVGLNSIKVVSLKKSKEKILLDNYVIANSQKPLIEVGENGAISELAGTVVKEAMRSAGLKSRMVNVAIPSFTSLIITIEIPSISSGNFEDVVRKEVARYIPVKIDDVVYDWQVINQEVLHSSQETGAESNGRLSGRNYQDKGQMIKILVIAIMKEISAKYEEVFYKNELRINLLEIDSISLSRALTGRRPGVYIILDIGHEVCNIIIAAQGNILINRTVDIGGNKMTEVIAKTFKINNKRAEQLKIQKGIQAGIIPGSRQNALTPLLSILVEEIKKTKELFREDFGGATVNEILVSGGTAKMIGLKEFLTEQTGLKTTVANALQDGIEVPAAAQGAVEKEGALLNIATGLALADFLE